MSDFDLLIKGGTAAIGMDVVPCDIGVKDGRFAVIGAGLDGPAKEVVDASRALRPARRRRPHVHIDQPSGSAAEMCDTFETGERLGRGRRHHHVVCFVWQTKGQSLAAIAADYRRTRQEGSRVDYAFHLTITDPTRP